MKIDVKITVPNRDKYRKKADAMQRFIDSEIIKKCAPYVPYKEGILRGSVKEGTIIGSGRLRWIVPYARRRYYEGRRKGKRGPRWVARAMKANRKSIIKGAIKVWSRS